jgi:hypothetical protein
MKLIQAIIASYAARLDTVVAVHGISKQQELDGVPVPKDWVYDSVTEHYVPPALHLDHQGSA